MNTIKCTLLVIGGGPGGYVCAIRAGQLGVDTVVVEAERLGGTCLNVGCIPSKALIHAAEQFAFLKDAMRGSMPGIQCSAPTVDLKEAVAWKDGIVQRLNGGVATLLRKARIRVVQGRARFRDGKTVAVATGVGETEIQADYVVIATGSAPVELPFLPFGGHVISSTEALALSELPQRVAVIGAGYIGLELGTAFAKLGSEVVVVEARPKLLPLYDEELTAPVASRLCQLGIQVLLGSRAVGVSNEGALIVQTSEGAERHLPSNKILVAVGRRPSTDGLCLDELVLEMKDGYIRIDERCETSMRRIFAIGDVTGEPMLAHRAMAQGETVAEIVAGKQRVWDRRAIPAVCFTDPEIVSIGLNAEEARRAGAETIVSQFPFAANGRAMTLQSCGGFVRVIAHQDSHELLGIQAVGQGVSELSAAFSLAIEMGARLEDVGKVVHAHPTLSESFQEASLRALGQPVHI